MTQKLLAWLDWKLLYCLRFIIYSHCVNKNCIMLCHILLCYSSKYAQILRWALVLPAETFTTQTYHATSKESNHPDIAHIPFVRNGVPPRELSPPLELLLCWTNFCIDAFLNITILISSIQWSVSIFHSLIIFTFFYLPWHSNHKPHLS